MAKFEIMKKSLTVICVMMLMSQLILAVPAGYPEYEYVPSVYEYLLQRQKEANRFGNRMHSLVRKDSRTPSLRLRFGRRSDPAMNQDMMKYKGRDGIADFEDYPEDYQRGN